MPSFTGKAIDYYRGEIGLKKVSSGPGTVILTLKKLKEGEDPESTNPVYLDHLQEEYSLTDIEDSLDQEKSTRFSITTPFPLIDGYYQVELSLKDKAGNSYHFEPFYLSLNYQGKTLSSQIEESPISQREEKEGKKEGLAQKVIEKSKQAIEKIKAVPSQKTKTVVAFSFLILLVIFSLLYIFKIRKV
jgi:hypothetical protein